jgi:hypothetical protein
MSNFDSLEIGIMPDYYRERKIIKFLKSINGTNSERKEQLHEKFMSMKLGCLPVIRKYIEDSMAIKDLKQDDRIFLEKNYEELMLKFKVNRNFSERDIAYMSNKFRMSGIFTVKKKRAFIKLGGLIIPRQDIKKIIIIH